MKVLESELIYVIVRITGMPPYDYDEELVCAFKEEKDAEEALIDYEKKEPLNNFYISETRLFFEL